jgi:DNA-binding MarR family transcriptional regulator
VNQEIRLSKDRQELLAEVGRAVRAHQNVQDAFDEAACEWLGINRSDGRCLDLLDQGGRLTAGQLAQASGLSTGAITTLLDRLERAGYVRRVRDTVDRRRVLVELTEEAHRRAEEIWGPIAEDGMGGLARYDDEELVFIRDFLRRGSELLARHLERVKALPPRREGGG